MKSIALMSLMTLFTCGLTIKTMAADPSDQKELLIFAGELRSFVELAQAASEISGDKTNSPEHDKLVKDMIATGERVGRVYFAQSPELIQTKLTEHLKRTLTENLPLKTYFVLLGNGFAKQADTLLSVLLAKQVQIKKRYLLGGIVVGVLGAGTFLWIRGRATQAVALNGKDWLIAGGILSTSSLIGFGAGRVLVARLPVDGSIKNAKDFNDRYGHGQKPPGETFIDDLAAGKDLQLGLSILNSTLGTN